MSQSKALSATRRPLLNALKWSYIGTFGDKALSAIFTFVLAAWLGPREYGIVSIATVYILFLQVFLDQGFVAALVQRQGLEQEHKDAVFWMDLTLSFGLVAISIVLSHWWAGVNHAPQVSSVISVLSLCIPIEGLAIVQRALLARQLDFRSLSIRSNVSVFAGGAVGIGLAVCGCGVWSLVGQQITKDFSALILLWKLGRWRPRFKFSWKHLRDLMGFSVSNFIAQLGVFADTYASSIVLGLFFGPTAVGLYRLADRVVGTAVGAATSSIQSVSLPEFSRYQDQSTELRASVLTCVRLSTTFTVPLLACLAMVSSHLMATIGTKWLPAAGALRVLCILGMLSGFIFFTGPLLQALSRVRLSALLEWARTVVSIVVLLPVGLLVRNTTVSSQIMAIALTRVAIGGLFVMPVFLYLMMRLAKISFRDVLSCVRPSALAAISIVFVLATFQSIDSLSRVKPAFLLGGEALLSLAIALPVVLLLDPWFRVTFLKLVNQGAEVKVLAGKQCA